MNKKIKMVWQFSGSDALKMADHHLIHLNEYIHRENVHVIDKGTVLVNDFSAISFIIIDNYFVQKLRVDLKPHKGFLVE
jgi:hypothetical protein